MLLIFTVCCLSMIDYLLNNPLVIIIISCFLVLLFALILSNRHLVGKIETLLQTQYGQQELIERVNNQLERSVEFNHQQQSLLQQQLSTNHQQFSHLLNELKVYFEQQISSLKISLLEQQKEHSDLQQKHFHQHQQVFNQNQLRAVDQIIEHLNKANQSNREELSKSLLQSSETISKRFDTLTKNTDQKLQEIGGQVEKRLTDGFEKTTKTFNDILKRLTLIDEAQKKITDLSENVVSLQEILADKRSRGAFGEVQLNSLIRNVLPEQHFAIQHTLSNGKIADCIMFLPKPTGNVVIDSKFPLESYRKMTDLTVGDADRKTANKQFKQDIKKHINDIHAKYIIENETSDGAIMFIPAEAIFSEIHAHQAELVEYANKHRVWLASPTTLMAILTTARSVLKDEATRKQIHIIQALLSELGTDFNRFRSRFDNLAKHIDQAATDVKQIHTSANKISSRFDKIDQVELSTESNVVNEKALNLLTTSETS